jgi:hypothetical protein
VFITRGDSVNDATHSTFQRRKLGGKLRRMREQAGLSLDQAAPRLDKTRSALHRIETGFTRADTHLVRTMMDVYDCYQPELLEEVREANKAPWYRVFGFKSGGYLDLETEASQISQYLVTDIPGLLQTEAYMRALFTTRNDPARVEGNTRARLFRQQRLTSDDWPLHMHTIVCETALTRRFGPPALMPQQLRQLATLAELPTVTLQVLRISGKAYVPNAPMTVLTYPDPEDPDLLYLENPVGHVLIENPVEVQEAKLVIDQLRIEALNPSDSVAYIEELVRNH